MKLSTLIFFIFIILGSAFIFVIVFKMTYDPQLAMAKPYLDAISINDTNLKNLATSLTSDCEGDKNCYVHKIYRYVAENYNYYEDIRGQEVIKKPAETIRDKGGDCEDFAILLNSLLENIGIKTYLVLTEGHAYSLACGIDPKKLWEYSEESLIKKFAEKYGEEKNVKTIVRNNELFIVKDICLNISLKPWEIYYYGGNGEKFKNPISYMNLKYEISSDKKIDFYVVDSKKEVELAAKNQEFEYYEGCHNNSNNINGVCKYLKEYGGVLLINENPADTKINLKLNFTFKYDTSKLFKDSFIQMYKIKGENCVVLDATAGEWGYAGYTNRSLAGNKTAFDSVSREYFYLE